MLGSICIPEIQIGKQTSKEDQTNPFVNAFILVEPKNKSSGSSYRHILCATSERERDEWVTALQYHTNSAKKTLLYPHQRSSSDTTLDTNDMGQAKIRHRSSMDQSMLHYYNPKKEHSSVLLSKASADSLPIVISHSDDDDTQLKKSKNRRTFWPPRKLFSNQEKQQQKRSGVFGVSLEEVVNTSRISNSCELPAIAYRCIEYLEASNAVKEEGLYRLSGSSVEVDDLRNLFNEMGDVDLLNSGEYHDVHAVAGLLKLWLRELPVNILTPDLATDFLSAVGKLQTRHYKKSNLNI